MAGLINLGVGRTEESFFPGQIFGPKWIRFDVSFGRRGKSEDLSEWEEGYRSLILIRASLEALARSMARTRQSSILDCISVSKLSRDIPVS